MPKKLVMTRGLPGSGKSHWALNEALKIEEAGFKATIVNKDDIRKELVAMGWQWSHENEKEVISRRNESIKSAFLHGKNVVISSDTNFGKHENQLREIAQACGAEFEIKDFTDVPVEVCIERDSRRPNLVGAEVIKQMYNTHIAEQIPVVYKPDKYAQKAIICDLDGTLALHKNRSPYDFKRVKEDRVNTPIADIIKLFAASAFTILYVSGRDEWCSALTLEWLQENGLPARGLHKIFMRGNSDKRKDNVVKQEIFDTHIRNQYNVHFVLDDRNQVVNMWRSLGLTCLQVAEGNF